MATLPYFLLGPSTVLSTLGLIRGSDPTTPTPPEDWRQAKVDVVIPARNEQENIALALASVRRQTFKPRRIVLVDDGSTDLTVEAAENYCAAHGLEIVTIRRRSSIGKTPTIKRQALELDSDVEFILDADTILESDQYIARTVEELYKSTGIASACGTILPLPARHRNKWMSKPDTYGFSRPDPADESPLVRKWLRGLARGVTNLYREVLYLFLQRFIYRGQMVFFGTTSNPVGCAVAYRRKYVQRLFEHFTPILGDDLTNSEDIFIGLALLNEGYRNIQLTDVYARTAEPPLYKLPRQVYLWSSAFLQSCYYFDPLVKSPLQAARRLARRDRILWRASRAPDRRRIQEPYRQAFGRERTTIFGRPAGWILMMSAVEKVFFPTALLIMLILRNWQGLALTVVLETLAGIIALGLVMKGQRFEYVMKGLAVAPLRYALLASDLFTLGRFATDMWITKNRNWRK
jgi:glycosyltransferase involved in cell wall biosynthesis